MRIRLSMNTALFLQSYSIREIGTFRLILFGINDTLKDKSFIFLKNLFLYIEKRLFFSYNLIRIKLLYRIIYQEDILNFVLL